MSNKWFGWLVVEVVVTCILVLGVWVVFERAFSVDSNPLSWFVVGWYVYCIHCWNDIRSIFRVKRLEHQVRFDRVQDSESL